MHDFFLVLYIHTDSTMHHFLYYLTNTGLIYAQTIKNLYAVMFAHPINPPIKKFPGGRSDNGGTSAYLKHTIET